jgi:hypothetical protein
MDMMNDAHSWRALNRCLCVLVSVIFSLCTVFASLAADGSSESVPAIAGSDEHKAVATNLDLDHACPNALDEEAATALRRRQPAIAGVTRPALQSELVLMAANDQAARLDQDPSTPLMDRLAKVDQHNLIRLKQILRQDGFPTAKMVGYNGVAAAWLLLQHAGDAPELWRRWLPTLAARARSGELSADELALTTDRELISSGQLQRYGTQGVYRDGELVIRPTEDPANLDKRRKSLGMIPEADYVCVLRFYTPTQAKQ